MVTNKDSVQLTAHVFQHTNKCYYHCSSAMMTAHFTCAWKCYIILLIGMLWLCIYPISHYWFLSCSRLFHSVYIVLILNCTPMLGFSCKSCLWCLLLSGLLVCCDSFFLVLYPFCFLLCSCSISVSAPVSTYCLCSYSEAIAGYVCVPSLHLTRNPKQGSAQLKFTYTIFFLGVHLLIFKEAWLFRSRLSIFRQRNVELDVLLRLVILNYKAP